MMLLQEVVARLIVQSQQAFFQAQTKNPFQPRASNVDMFTVVNAEAQYKRKLKQTIREINDEMPRIAELRQSLGNVRCPLPSTLTTLRARTLTVRCVPRRRRRHDWTFHAIPSLCRESSSRCIWTCCPYLRCLQLPAY